MLVQALNDGRRPFTTTDHLIADLWSLATKKDHPERVAAEAKFRREAKAARVIQLRQKFEQRKRAYGLR